MAIGAFLVAISLLMFFGGMWIALIIVARIAWIQFFLIVIPAVGIIGVILLIIGNSTNWHVNWWE